MQLLLFALVGVANTAFTYAIYAFGLWAGLGYVLANLIALPTGAFFGFFAQGKLVFSRAEPRRLPRFLLMWAALWMLNLLSIRLILPIVKNDAYVAGALALVPMVLLSFLGQKYLVFAPPRQGR